MNEHAASDGLPVPSLVAPDARLGLGEAANAFYGDPTAALELVGVTGTNGKTSTAYILRHILNSAGKKAGMLGTIEYDTGGEVEPSPLTTPDAVQFTRCLAAMRDNGCQAAVVETSSHALSQARVWPHRFKVAIFTNLTRDHLDYHGDMENYLQAKKILFQSLSPDASAVVNLDDPHTVALVDGIDAPVYGYTFGEKNLFNDRIVIVRITEESLSGQTIRLTGNGVDGEISVGLIGRHNAANFAGAVLAALRLGIPFPEIQAASRTFPGVPGRLERLDGPSGAAVFVDYAHTDDAIRSVLSILRPLTPGKIVTVFGCGGDRDRGKRPLMAEAAERGSDVVVVTSDNPRTENPDQIFADIAEGFADRGKVTLIPDRASAIRHAVQLAGKGDAVLVAGKGHEDYQIIGTRKIHLDDREPVRDAFKG
jgi:UDP-N-acetylmuramyl-tripeptide synthetase